VEKRIQRKTIWVLVAILVLGLAARAAAADLPSARTASAAYVAPAPLPGYDWTGIYIGANAGYGFATASTTATFSGSSITSSENLSGFVGGGQLGGNYQIGSLVIGLEADFDYSAQSHTASAGIFSATESIPWIGTLRGRIGYAIGRALIYGTAGAAEGKFSSTVSANGFGSISGSRTHAAWTAGGGIEVGLTGNLSARLEYLYLDTGNINLGTAFGVTVTGRVQDNLVRAGLNWRFPL
jgi:outer membrane immunogenic protein